jgi:nicotinate-nucleotide pyrophosphorylase (carboxylating)
MAAMIWSSRRSSENLSKLVIMLDNFNPERCKAVADEMTELEVREHVILEASGGITFDDINDWKECGLDILSTSTINRGVAPLDVSMLVNSA